MLKRLIIGSPLELVARRALDLVKPRSSANYRSIRDDIYAARILSQLPDNGVCIDVGSHMGTWLEHFAEKSPPSHRIAIEPLPHLAKRLRKNFPSVEVHEVALSDEPGTASFIHALDLEGWSGFHKQGYLGETRTEEMSVAVDTLDRIVGDRQVSFIKIDVEGAELGVLKGATRTLRRCRPIVYFEMAHIHFDSYGVTCAMVHHYLADHGLHVATLSRKRLTGEQFERIVAHARDCNYGKTAQTNFLALPV